MTKNMKNCKSEKRAEEKYVEKIDTKVIFGELTEKKLERGKL